MDHLLGPIFDALPHLIRSGGLWAILGLMLVESCCIPAPSEITMLFAGYLVYTGDHSFVAVVAVGVLGNVIGSVLCWYIGAYGGRAFVDRHGRWVRLNHHHLDLAERWFARWGTPAVFFARMLPVVRTFISLPAGMARMPLPRFTLLTVLGCIPWVTGLAWLGYALGDRWKDARDTLHQFDYVVILGVVLVIAVVLVRRRRARRDPDDADGAAA